MSGRPLAAGGSGISTADRLPPTANITALAARWNVTLDHPLPGSTCSEVWSGDRQGEKVVLKLPRPDAEEARSLPTLRAFSQWGGVTVLEADEPTGAVLLPLLGATLADRKGGDDHLLLRPTDQGPRTTDQKSDDGNTWIFAGAALRLRQAEKVPAPSFPEYAADAFGSNDEVLREPLRLVSRLLDTAPALTLTHGDLHHFNLLEGEGGYVAIDPKGVLTDPASEVIAWVRNPRPEAVTPEKVRRRLEIVAEAWGESYDRLWGWAWAGNVISQWWNEPTGPYDGAEAVRQARLSL